MALPWPYITCLLTVWGISFMLWWPWDAFCTRLHMFPSLVNCCTIDWFQVFSSTFSTSFLHDSLLAYPLFPVSLFSFSFPSSSSLLTPSTHFTCSFSASLPPFFALFLHLPCSFSSSHPPRADQMMHSQLWHAVFLMTLKCHWVMR